MLALGNLFINQLGTHPTYFFAVIITVVVSITLHELAHGWVAIWLGDDTPALTGHMTLNPLIHMGVFSLLLLFTMGMAFGAMPVNHTRLRGRYAESLVALAGPAMNLVLGVLALVALGLWIRFGSIDPENQTVQNGVLLLQVFGFTNLALMLFNLIPFPPLDGSYVMANLIPAYRKLLGSETARGAATAVLFALFLGGAEFIYVLAYRMGGFILDHVIGHAA